MEIVIQVFIRFLHTDVFPFLGFFFVFFVFVSMHPIFRSDYPLPPDGLNTF